MAYAESFPQRRPSKHWRSLVFSVVLANLAGAAGALVTQPATNQWYQSLAKPAFQPPSWLFGPVWTVLYVLMGIAAWIVWKQRSNVNVRPALTIYGVQLVLNTLWTFLFFGARQLAGSSAEIVALWVSIVATMILFSRIRKSAMLLLVPYIAWVTFASVLNFTIWRLNA